MPDKSTLGLDLLNQNILYRTPFSIDPSLQRAIINETLACGGVISSESDIIPPVWVGAGVAKIQHNTLNNPSVYQDGRLPYYLRLKEDVEWQWLNNKLASLVQQALSPAQKLFLRVTRVTVLLQIPGQAIPAHRDLIPGNTYEQMQSNDFTFLGDKTLPYLGESWLQDLALSFSTNSHEKNHFLNFKFPLSMQESNGDAYIIWNNKKLIYDPQGHGFLLNEAYMEHGADIVDFYRGVIFVDGFIDTNYLSQMAKTPILLRDIKDP